MSGGNTSTVNLVKGRWLLFSSSIVAVIGTLWLVTDPLYPAMATNIQADSHQVITMLMEYESDLSPPGHNVSSCIKVSANGQFHLERRGQFTTGAGVEYFRYDGVLDSLQLQRLRDLLADAHIQALPEFRRPNTPATKYYYHEFLVVVPGDHETKALGYAIWKSHGPAAPGSSLETSPEEVRRVQENAAAALQPFVQWFRSVSMSGLRRSEKPPTGCDMDQ